MKFRKKENARKALIETRPARVAGQFYEGTASVLLQQLEKLFTTVEIENFKSSTQLQAIITPHAGYMFSGKVAASAYNQISENACYKRVFVIASSHRFAFDGAAVCSFNYTTPLGEMKTDIEIARELTDSSNCFVFRNDVHEPEHSIEVQLPFIQYKLKTDFLLVPIILGTQNPETCKKIANDLKPWFTPENLWIISTDFSHYPDYENAIKVDECTATAICSNQAQKLLDILKENKMSDIENLATSLCGWTSVLTLLYLTQNQDFNIEKLLYQNSGDAQRFGDKKRVVGYWSMAVCKKPKEFSITETEKAELLAKARSVIIAFVQTGKIMPVSDAEFSGIFLEKTGVFVSVYVDGKLRGCIGNFAGNKTLNELVQKMAVSAACDRRFKAVQPEELEKMTLEISVLSPLKKIESIGEIELGKHGIYIKKGFRSGTFLPQVATKTGWSLEEFLGHCARDKAGIGWDGWKDAEIFVYEAVILS